MSSRDWIKLRDRFSKEYIDGVYQFMDTAKPHANSDGKIRCLCEHCQNAFFQPLDVVRQHLFTKGMSSTYDLWIHHGDPIPAYREGRGGDPQLARTMPHIRIESIADWHTLCDRWKTPEWKKLSETNANSRKQQKHGHRCGSKSFDRLQYELETERGVDLGPVDMFKETRYDPDKGWVNDVSATTFDQMRDVLNAEVPEGSQPPTQADACLSVLGENAGYVRTMGLSRQGGSSQSRGKMASASKEEFDETKAKMEAELEATKAEIAALKETANQRNQHVMNMQHLLLKYLPQEATQEWEAQTSEHRDEED